MTNKISIVGSHGLYVNYGGFEQLVINLSERNRKYKYIIFNSKDSNKSFSTPKGSEVIFLPLKASGFQGIFYDYWSILISYTRKVDCMLLLGNQGILVIPFLNLLFKKKPKFITNVGGIEWKREKFNFLQKLYLKLAYKLSNIYCESIILDNEYFLELIHNKTYNKYKNKYVIIPYGGDLTKGYDKTSLLNEYKFLKENFYLSISRAIQDNQIVELLETWQKRKEILVVISNFSTSEYGKQIWNNRNNLSQNITLINGLYNKKVLDTIRRECSGYIHTHSTCGSAPSLIEMLHARVPIISFDVPQNRFTLENQCVYFNNFHTLNKILDKKAQLPKYIPSQKLQEKYLWKNIINRYEELF